MRFSGQGFERIEEKGGYVRELVKNVSSNDHGFQAWQERKYVQRQF